MAASNRLIDDSLNVQRFGLHVHDIEAEVQTLANRHLFKTPDPEIRSVAWRELKNSLDELGNMMGPVAISPKSLVLSGKTGRKLKRMQAGIRDYYMAGVQHKHSNIKEMQKLELYRVGDLAVKECRGIQYRDVRYNAALSRHLLAIEHKLRNLAGRNRSVPFLAKGKDCKQRAVALAKQAERFDDPVWVCADHSRFDAHVNPELLALEHRFYLQRRGYNRELKRLLKWQRKNTGRTCGGVEYKMRGKRMSGDLNTALGNSLLNYGMLSSWLKCSGVDGEIFLDGDDSVIVLERSSLPYLLAPVPFFEQFGMVTVTDVVEEFSKVDFCQTRPVYSPEIGLYMCPNPLKRLGAIQVTAQNVSAEMRRDILVGKIACELAVSNSMPMMAPAAKVAEELGGGGWVPQHRQYRLLDKHGMTTGHIKCPKWREPSEAERLTFAAAWGISPSMQVSYEQEQSYIPLFDVQSSCSIKAREFLEPLGDEWLDARDDSGCDMATEKLAWADLEQPERDCLLRLLSVLAD